MLLFIGYFFAVVSARAAHGTVFFAGTSFADDRSGLRIVSTVRSVAGLFATCKIRLIK